MPSTTAVLCDLDDTLFDHWRCTRGALKAIRGLDSSLSAWSLEECERHHRRALEAWHLRVLSGERSIDEARIGRFTELLTLAGADRVAERAVDLAAAYRRAYAGTWHPVAGALDLAAAIKSAGATLIIVTNNVVVEQRLKLSRCGLDPYVDALVTSEEIGAQKPDTAIFAAALGRAGVVAGDAVMLGDAWHTDIVGAQRAGIRPVWLNRFGEASADPSVAELRSLEPTDSVLKTLIQ